MLAVFSGKVPRQVVEVVDAWGGLETKVGEVKKTGFLNGLVTGVCNQIYIIYIYRYTYKPCIYIYTCIYQ